jgi:hypothetical protein
LQRDLVTFLAELRRLEPVARQILRHCEIREDHRNRGFFAALQGGLVKLAKPCSRGLELIGPVQGHRPGMAWRITDALGLDAQLVGRV